MPKSENNGAEDRQGGRPFPWVCPHCRKKDVRPTTITYRTERLYDGRLIVVNIPNLEVPKCASCGELVFNYAADEQIIAAVKAQAASPQQIA